MKKITFDEVTDLNVVDFLNTIAYSKSKAEWERQRMEKMKKKLKQSR